MGEHDFLFWGILVVGIGLTVKVTVDGRAHLAALVQKWEVFEKAATECLEKADQEEAKAKESEGQVLTLKAEYEVLAEREKMLRSKIDVLKKTGPQKRKQSHL